MSEFSNLREIFPEGSFKGIVISIEDKQVYDFILDLTKLEFVINYINTKSKNCGQSLVFAGEISSLYDELKEAHNYYNEYANFSTIETCEIKMDDAISLMDIVSDIVSENQECLAFRICPNDNKPPEYIFISVTDDEKVIIASTNVNYSKNFVEELWDVLRFHYINILGIQVSGKPFLDMPNFVTVSISGVKQIVGTYGSFIKEPWFSDDILLIGSLKNIDTSNLDETYEIPTRVNHGKLCYLNFAKEDINKNEYTLTVLIPYKLTIDLDLNNQIIEAVKFAKDIIIRDSSITIEKIKSDKILFNILALDVNSFFDSLPTKFDSSNFGQGIWQSTIIIPLIQERGFMHFIEGGNLSRSKIKKKERELLQLFETIHSNTISNTYN